MAFTPSQPTWLRAVVEDMNLAWSTAGRLVVWVPSSHEVAAIEPSINTPMTTTQSMSAPFRRCGWDVAKALGGPSVDISDGCRDSRSSGGGGGESHGCSSEGPSVPCGMVAHHTDGFGGCRIGSLSWRLAFYHVAVAPPGDDDTWCAISDSALPIAEVTEWANRPDCGAVVTFIGTARDHSADRPGVSELTYEAYEDQAVARLGQLVAELRRRWPDVVRAALVHRVGTLAVGDAAVVVAVSSPHRDAAFEAARFAIDELKATVPIWKREVWEGGQSWGLEAQHLRAVGEGPP